MALKRSAASGAAAGEGENAGMTCTKCGGLVIDEWDERRCVNCGRRPDEAHVMQTEDRRPKTEDRRIHPSPTSGVDAGAPSEVSRDDAATRALRTRPTGRKLGIRSDAPPCDAEGG